MSPLLWITGLLIALAAGLTAAMKKWKIGPFLDMPSTDSLITPAPEQPPGAPYDHTMPLETFCRALAAFEGANPTNNNPGNCRCSPIGYLPKYGHVTCNPHNFAVFPTYGLGWGYLTELVHHRINAHPTWTFYDFFANYAPSTDGNEPRHYAETVAKACAYPPSTILSEVLV